MKVTKRIKANAIVGFIILFIINIPCFIYLYRGMNDGSSLYYIVLHVMALNYTALFILISYGLSKLYKWLIR